MALQSVKCLSGKCVPKSHIIGSKAYFECQRKVGGAKSRRAQIEAPNITPATPAFGMAGDKDELLDKLSPTNDGNWNQTHKFIKEDGTEVYVQVMNERAAGDPREDFKESDNVTILSEDSPIMVFGAGDHDVWIEENLGDDVLDSVIDNLGLREEYEEEYDFSLELDLDNEEHFQAMQKACKENGINFSRASVLSEQLRGPVTHYGYSAKSEDDDYVAPEELVVNDLKQYGEWAEGNSYLVTITDVSPDGEVYEGESQIVYQNPLDIDAESLAKYFGIEPERLVDSRKYW